MTKEFERRNYEIARRFAGLTDLQMAEKLAQALDVSPSWLLGEPETMTLHDPLDGQDFACPILRAEEIAGYGMLYHVYLDEIGDVVPVIVSAGMQFTPTDWTRSDLPKSAAEIVEQTADPAGVRWMDEAGRDTVLLDGLPRVFA